MKPHPVPKVGDTVVLNDFGLSQVFNRTMGLAHMKTLRMKVTHVDSESMTFPEPTYCLEVDNAEINAYLIDHHCFDVVERGVKAGPLSAVASGRGHSSVRYEDWSGTHGRGGIQRTLDRNNAVDAAFLSDSVSIVDDNGNERPMTFDEADRMGVRVIVSARKIMPEGDWS
jgi:hypothetical protein